jgi:hypothetical protein
MYDYRTVNTLTLAVSEILIPKFHEYLKVKQNDPSLLLEVKQEIQKMEALEDLIEDKIMSLSLPEEFYKHSISIGGFYFEYNPIVDSFQFSGDKEGYARNTVFNKHHLFIMRNTESLVKHRIAAIIATLEETSFDEVVKIVEGQLNWDEFLK